MVLAEVAVAFLAWSQDIMATWGYLGLFAISFVGSATIILPILPTFLVIFALGPALNPWLVGLAAGAGAAAGELVGYAIGRGGRQIISQKYTKWLERAQKWADRYDMFFVIMVFAATPLPDDVLGVFGGIIGYDLKRFFAASLIGKVIMNLVLAWAGFLGIGWIRDMFGGI